MKTKVLSVNYNTPDLIYAMVKSFRQFYDNEILIVDGSDKKEYEEAKVLLNEFDNIEIHHFNGNIHHGPGMGYAFNAMACDKILVIDSDVIIYKGGFLELLEAELKKESYGVGDIQRVDDRGFNIGSRKGAIGLRESDKNELGYAYLHPAFMLINRNIAINWPLPIKHGAPMIETMKAIHNMGQERILQHCEWIHNDFRNEEKIYFRHDWMGTVNKTGGYHL
jgi:glycosyltransferase involved in cell wall biosynthesis